MIQNKDYVKNIAFGGMIAALYVALTYVAAAFGLSSGVIQFRLSEVLCILPVFISPAVPGLFIGCFLANLLTGCAFWDVIFGSIATLLGAIGTRLLRRNRYLASVPPIVSNMLIVPFVLQYVYGVEDSYLFLMATVGLGELVCAGIGGQLLYQVLWSRREMFEE